MNKQGTLGFALAIGLLLGGNAAYAEKGLTPTTDARKVSSVTIVLNSRTALVDGQALVLPVEPTRIGDTTMVPIRAISEALGANVEWLGDENAIAIRYEDFRLRLVIGSLTASVGDRTESLEQPAQIVNESTMVPLRFIAENLDKDVQFDAAAGTITIMSKRQEESPSQHESPAKDAAKQAANESEKELAKNVHATRTKLDPIRMEALIDMKDMNADLRNIAIRPRSIVTDKAGSVYVLFGQDRAVGLLKYDAKTKRVEVLLDKFDSRFNFSYTELLKGKREFPYTNLAPETLYYDESSDSVYLLAYNTNATYNQTGEAFYKSSISSVVYRIVPGGTIEMVTHGDYGSLVPSGSNFLLAEGKQVYFSDIVHGQIYTSEAGGSAIPLAPIDKSEGGAKLAATFKEGSIYYLDLVSRKLHEVNPTNGDTRLVTKLDDENLRFAAAVGGKFYVADYERMYELDTDGKLTPYVTLGDVNQPDERGEWQETKNSNGSVMRVPISGSMQRVSDFGMYTVKADGNIVLSREGAQPPLRIIRLYEETKRP
ncbi:copper amine oxidase N-terminal domain-containing protein [Paenibacillus hodogayensis]|uniref:Copper amine oxidase N-terminal domain-containing protein n=1 Tax=Paenibacillus hodogayensis TaxID=279208 RepID=A0ABV5W573_9BACL